MQVRRDKRERMLADGVAPYPVTVPRTATLRELREKYGDLPTDTSAGEYAAVTGRIVNSRNTGKLCFATLQEGDGTTLQAMLSLDRVGQERLDEWKALVDLGDLVSVEGEVATSRRGELSVMVERWTMAAKALRPLPNTYRPLNEETRVRQRYVDLIVRPEARDMVRTRATVMRSLRESFHRRDFIEVETPMLQVLQGGATARPFVTHMNAYDIDLFLRIAPELYLKRAVVGGVDKVFEINRNFRNEGADRTHSPEFAMLEFYQAYSDYNGVALLTQQLIQEACEAVFGGHVATHVDGSELDLSGTWPSITLYDSLSEALGEEVTVDTSLEELTRIAQRLGVDVDPSWGPGKLGEELFEHLVPATLQRPTFVRDFPEETSPLVRQHRETPGLVEKWDLYVNGYEQGTGYSELVDAVVQRARLVEQASRRSAGDAEAMQLDEDFLRALEYGMPPCGGQGMGIDRLLMTLTGLGIRETILFPLVKPE
ncbi:MAG: lysine--tRNA ligase [Actinomycetes bacterium]